MTWTQATAPLDEIRLRPIEMLSAGRVQARLQQRSLPPLETLDYAGLCVSGREVGGDFYDFLAPHPDRLALIAGDVSGKGVPAALMMAALQANLRSHYALSSSDLERRIESVHRLFFECTASQHYASLFVGEYDDASGRLRYANCGHVPPLLLHDDSSVTRLESTATVLGLFESWDGRVAEVTLARGDLLVVATDGILEATNGDGEHFGELRLLSEIARHRRLSPDRLIRTIVRKVRAHEGGRQVDDQTLVVARVR
jgi:serine phosphatase RsbU (regulator of sigma subunit)